MELQRNTHHVFRLMYHFVWIPKYRHKVFMEPYRTTMKAIIKKIGYDYDIEIVELEIPEDHIHMVIRSIPKQSPSNVMQIVKSITAREFFRIYPEIKKKYFGEVSCGHKVILWKRLVMLMKRQLENMFKTSLLN